MEQSGQRKAGKGRKKEQTVNPPFKGEMWVKLAGGGNGEPKEERQPKGW